MKNITKVLIAVGASVAIGAALGILYAPDEGSEIRKKIVKRTKKLRGSVTDSLGEGMESLEDIKDVLQKELHKVNRKIEELKF